MYLWKKENIPHYNKEIDNGFMPSMHPYIVKNSKSCVVICPGGAYRAKAMLHEGEHIAKWLNSIGVSAFVLDYRLKPYEHPIPVIDGKRAVRYARHLSDEYGYDRDKIGIMGFSAGGHLAGSIGTFKDNFGYEPIDDIDKESSRPDFMILCYAVLSFTEYAHRGSFENLTSDLSALNALRLSVDKNVDADTPPAFIWHCTGDESVPVENSLNMALALRKYRVPFEIHTFNDGPHGVGLANGTAPAPLYEHTAVWIKNLKNWLECLKFID